MFTARVVGRLGTRAVARRERDVLGAALAVDEVAVAERTDRHRLRPGPARRLVEGPAVDSIRRYQRSVGE
ncbi:hypothetical protein ACFQL4_28940 [Halosimplex aquaticum]